MLRNTFLLCLMWSLLASPARGSGPEVTLAADIGPRPVAEALAAFGRQTGLQLIYVSTIAETQQSKGAHAGLTASEALTQLLDGTGLRFEFLNDRTVSIFAASEVVPTVVAALPVRPQGTERRTGFQALALEEVVVTATRREQQASRVPIDLAVWTQEDMEASGVKDIEQLAALTPGVEFDARAGIASNGYTDLAIRGVTNRFGATVGIYVDDTQIPPARAATNLRSFPVAFDLDRVEILRGPQGALLGDHTQGGAIRFITTEPSLSAFTGLARAEWAATQHGGTDYVVAAAAGGPIVTDVLGYRVSGWSQRDGGYVDRVDPLTRAIVDVNINRSETESVHGALTFAPARDVHITTSFIYQSLHTHDTPGFTLALSNVSKGELRYADVVQQPFNETFYLASLKFTANLRVAELSAVSSYFDQYGDTVVSTGGFPPSALAFHFGLKQQMFSQELRLTSAAPDATLTWVAGALFSSDHTRHPETDTEVPSGIIDPGNTLAIRHSQLAAFGQIGWRVSKRLTATAGLRIGRSRYDSATEAPADFSAQAADTWTTPRFVLSWQAAERNLLYLTAAQGYGSGGVTPFPPIPHPPDTLWSYEIGSKHALFDDRVRLEAGIYHIHWSNGPPGAATVSNENTSVAGPANSNGFDLSVKALLGERTRVALALGYVDARYAETIEGTIDGNRVVYVRKGDAVYGFSTTAPWTVTASIERDFPLGTSATANVRAEDVFRSRNPGPFAWTDPYSPFYTGDYHPDAAVNILNLRARVRWSSFEATAFVNNALDSRPILNEASAFLQTGFAGTIPPRTAGLSGTWRF